MNDLQGLLSVASVGAAIGVFAAYLSKVTRRVGIVVDVFAGLFGALVVTWLSDSTGNDVPSLVLAALGATFVIGLEKIALGGGG
jgi:uncharacterized membrane protein YeaQ/YmgE (transglycosylase-associated protein family)